MTAASQFAEFFRSATGHSPYAYQEALGKMDGVPAVICVPTGAGKTEAAIVSWLHARRSGKAAPRRLVYALPMRALVEQTATVARELRAKLGLAPDELPIHTLRGGAERQELRDWQAHPEREQIVIGTIDMLLSRTLNRGYAESRFAWPVSFGLLNNDCRWIFDEVQLMGPARATSAQLDALRAKLGTLVPCETVWMSATVDRQALQTVDRPQLGDVLTLSSADRSGDLSTRLRARKTLRRCDLSAQSPGEVARSIAAAVRESHVAGTRTLLIVNTVALAQAVYGELRRASDGRSEQLVLLHSRFRPGERAEHLARAQAKPRDAGTIIVATQVVEAGIDMSARTLLTESAPFSSVVQRLGRCNRDGREADATVVWLDRGPLGDHAAGRALAAPYQPDEVELARQTLLAREGDSLSPDALEQIEVAQPPDEGAVLRRRDLLDLFDTTPDLSGMDIDIAPFIRDDDERTVSVLFRDVPADAPPQLLDEGAPARDELVQVPRDSLTKRTCWAADHIAGGWLRRAGSEIPPGATVLLRAADGGYSEELGWDGKARGAVATLGAEASEPVEGEGSDYTSEIGPPVELTVHLADVATAATTLADALGLGDWGETLYAAGALHDLGKAHPVFQATMLRVMEVGDDDERAHKLWAKSGAHGGRHKRHSFRHERHSFRHELASALAVLGSDAPPQIRASDLVVYLVAAHHGRVRLSIRPAADEWRPAGVAPAARFALGIVDGDELPEVDTPLGAIPATTLSLAPMELGAEDSWTDQVARLRDDPSLGPFRLAFLEALLRVADWRVSSA